MRIAKWMSAAALVCACGMAVAQDAPVKAEQPTAAEQPKTARQIDEAAKALMQDAAKAAAKYKSISYEASSEVSGPMASMMPAAKGKVSMTRIEGEPMGKFRVTGETKQGPGEPAKFELVNDGAKMWHVDHAAKKVTESAAADMRPLPGLDLLMWDFYSAEAMEVPDEATVLRILPESLDVGGVSCKVVEMVIEMQMGDGAPASKISVQQAFGADDKIVRRTRVEYPGMPGAGEGMSMTQTVTRTAMQFDQVSGEAYAFAAPEGYSSEKFEAPKGPELAFKVGETPADWTLKDGAGKEYTLSQMKGKVVVMDFWATWCGPCKRAMPGLQALHEHFKDKPVLVLGVNCWERENSDDYMKKQGFTYPNLLAGDEVAEKYGVSGIPTFYVIGKDARSCTRRSASTPRARKS